MSLVKSVFSVPRSYKKIFGAACAGIGGFILYKLFRANKSDKKEVSLDAKKEAEKVKNGNIELQTDYDEDDDDTEYEQQISGVRVPQGNNNRDDGGDLVPDGRRQVQKRTTARQTPYTVPTRSVTYNYIIQHVEDRDGHKAEVTEEDIKMVSPVLRELQRESGFQDGIDCDEPAGDLGAAEHANLPLEQEGELPSGRSLHLVQRQMTWTSNAAANAPVRTVSECDDQQVPQ